MGYNYKHKRHPLTKDETNRLMNACLTPKEKLLVWTLLDTGLRIAEFCSLDQTKFDWQGGSFQVIGKGNKPRNIPLTGKARAILENHFAVNTSIGISIRRAQEIVTIVAKRSGVMRKVCPHVLRHTFAVSKLQNGLSLPALQKLLGHSDLATTAIYLNLGEGEAIREFQEKFK